MLSLILVIASVAIAFLVGMWFGMAMNLPTNQPKQRREITELEREQILEALRQRRKIYALKLYRKWSRASLKEANEAIEQLKKELSS